MERFHDQVKEFLQKNIVIKYACNSDANNNF